MQRITAGTYREIWRESLTPLDGGASVAITTGLRAQAVSFSQVFGVLELRNVSGAPLITPTLSVSSTGHLVVTLTNAAVPGNSTNWQLDVTLHHSMQQGRDAGGQGAIYVLFGSGLGGDTANWPLDQVAYFILDGDAGNDAHLGYIVAPPGTVFAPAQTAAVAIRTTDRLASIIPKFGAGRSYVILAKPRAGQACYDASVPGDGLGTYRRDLLVGYGLQILRGSDLTNSPADRAQLAMRTVAGPFTVAAVSSDTYGFFIQCTAPIGVPVDQIGRYRLRATVAAAGGGTFYAACQNGNNIPVPNLDEIHVWTNSWGPIAPGDTVWLEEPDVRIYNYYEGLMQTLLPTTPPASHIATAGVELGNNGSGINGQVRLGSNANGNSPSYCCVRSQSCIIDGSLTAGSSFTNETGATGLFGGSGLDLAGGCTSSQNPDVVAIDFSYLDNSCNFLAQDLRITRSFCLLAVFAGCSKGLFLQDLHYDMLFLQQIGSASFERGVWHPTVNSLGIQVAAVGATLFADMQEITSPARPGVTLHPGQYTVKFNFDGNGVALGTGMRLRYDIVGGTPETIVTWASLRSTGFELEGGQQVLCIRSSQGYLSNLLPCPRGLVMRMVDGVAGTAIPVGMVVSAPAATPSRFALALSDAAANMRIVGALLTNAVQGDGATEGGYAVVGYDGFMVLRQEVGSGNPVSGDTLYLSNTQAGFVTNTPPVDPSVILGRAAPVGPNALGAGDFVPIAWEPEHILLPA